MASDIVIRVDKKAVKPKHQTQSKRQAKRIGIDDPKPQSPRISFASHPIPIGGAYCVPLGQSLIFSHMI